MATATKAPKLSFSMLVKSTPAQLALVPTSALTRFYDAHKNHISDDMKTKLADALRTRFEDK